MVGTIILISVFCLFIIILSINRRLRKYISKNLYLRLTLIFILLFIIGTIGMYLFERQENVNFSDLYQSFWSSIVFLISGYEDRAPESVPGKIMSLLIFIASFGILGSVAGNFAHLFMKQSEVRMSKNIKNHIVICNWNSKGEKIVNELHSKIALPDTPIIVLSENLPCKEAEDELRRTSESFDNVEFRNADPNLHKVLKRANISRAKSIIILADRKSPDPDAESVLTAVAIKSILDRENFSDITKKPYIVAEALEQEKVEHLKDSGVNEIICPVDYGIKLLSQCAIYPKLSQVYERLLTYSEETNEIYVINDPKLLKFIDGKTFMEVSKFFADKRDETNPVILIGVKREERVILNPKKETDGSSLKLTNRDGLIVISYQNPDFRRLFKYMEGYEK